MFIQTEDTPNPASLKFIPGREVSDRGNIEFKGVEQVGSSPLAQRLFAVGGVKGVFFGQDFITVTKENGREWQVLKPFVLGAIAEHFLHDHPVFSGEKEIETTGAGDDEIVSQIKELLETRVRPAVAQDGGDIVFHSFEDGIVYLQMQGSCSGCPSSTATLKMGIENMLRHYLPEVIEVRPV